MLHTGTMPLRGTLTGYQRTRTNCYILSPRNTRNALQYARHTPAVAARRVQRGRRTVFHASSSDSNSGDGEAFDLAQYYEAKLENGTSVDTRQ